MSDVHLNLGIENVNRYGGYITHDFEHIVITKAMTEDPEIFQFTLAHELGHYHCNHWLPCTKEHVQTRQLEADRAAIQYFKCPVMFGIKSFEKLMNLPSIRNVTNENRTERMKMNIVLKERLNALWELI